MEVERSVSDLLPQRREGPNNEAPMQSSPPHSIPPHALNGKQKSAFSLPIRCVVCGGRKREVTWKVFVVFSPLVWL